MKTKIQFPADSDNIEPGDKFEIDETEVVVLSATSVGLIDGVECVEVEVEIPDGSGAARQFGGWRDEDEADLS